MGPTRYYANLARIKVVCLEVHDEPPEVKESGTKLKSITLLIVDRRQIWLLQEHLEWAIKYLFIQHLLKGVPLVSPDSQGPSGAAPSVTAHTVVTVAAHSLVTGPSPPSASTRRARNVSTSP